MFFRFDKPHKLRTRVQHLANKNAQGGVIDRLYTLLDILDQKSAGLLQFNAIMIAASAVLMSEESTTFFSIPGIVMVIALIACGLALSVLHVSWPFLENIHRPGAEEMELAKTIECRRRLYACALASSWAAVIVLIARVVIPETVVSCLYG